MDFALAGRVQAQVQVRAQKKGNPVGVTRLVSKEVCYHSEPDSKSRPVDSRPKLVHVAWQRLGPVGEQGVAGRSGRGHMGFGFGAGFGYCSSFDLAVVSSAEREGKEVRHSPAAHMGSLPSGSKEATADSTAEGSSGRRRILEALKQREAYASGG
jgi:hypothetical protein